MTRPDPTTLPEQLLAHSRGVAFFDLLGLDAAAPLLRGDEILFVHRHHGYEFVGGFHLDLAQRLPEILAEIAKAKG